MPPNQVKPYQLIDCFLVSYFLLFFTDTLWLIYAYPGTASLFEDKSIYFFFIEFQYIITLVEGTLLGTGLALCWILIRKLLPVQIGNGFLNFLFIVLIVFLSRKAMQFLELASSLSITRTATFSIWAGLVILLLVFISTSIKNLFKSVISKNVVEGGKHLGYLSFILLVVFSLSFLIKPIVADELRNKYGDANSMEMADAQKVSTIDLPDILFIVYDGLSARNTGFENYPRRTTPNIERFAENAYYFKNHFSNYNQTSPSFSSLVTGKTVLHHRVFQHGGLIPKDQTHENIFKYTKKLGYKNILYTHVLNSEAIFRQFQESFYQIKPSHELRAYSEHLWEIFIDTPYLRFGKELGKFKPKSSFIDAIYLRITKDSGFQEQYTAPTMYVNELVHEWFYEIIRKERGPKLIFLHLFPPHDPFNYRRDFEKKFLSTPIPLLKHPTKPTSKIASVPSEKLSEAEVSRAQLEYDRLLYDTDQKFGKFMEELRKTEFFDSSLIIFTSDHGMQFGNGFSGHGNMLYNEKIKVPLIIKFPGQKQGEVLNQPTSSLDIAPSLLSYLNQDVPEWMDGKVLPGFPGARVPDEPRAIYSYAAQRNKPHDKINNIIVSLIKYPYKFIYYSLPETFELYNVQTDFFEVSDISANHPEISARMKQEVKKRIEYFDSKYSNSGN